MAQVEIARNEVEDPALARQIETEITEAVAEASEPEEGRVECSILDEGLHVEIEMEVPGWVERIPLASPTRPGEARRAVARVLRDIGLVA